MISGNLIFHPLDERYRGASDNRFKYCIIAMSIDLRSYRLNEFRSLATLTFYNRSLKNNK